MSKIFYDHLIAFEEIEIELDKLRLGAEERKELEEIIDQTLHHRVLNRILTHLPTPHHQEFLTKFHETPYDRHLLTYLNEKIEESVEKHVQDEVEKLKHEILEDIRSSSKRSKTTRKK